MSLRRLASTAALAALSLTLVAELRPAPRLNPVIALLEADKPVFGLYAPANRRGGEGAEGQKPPGALAGEALAYAHADFLFDGSMEGDFEGSFGGYAAFADALAAAGGMQRGGSSHMRAPLIVKTPEIAPDPAAAAARIARQLNEGASAIVFVDVRSAEEVRAGLAAMRFRSSGGTRPDAVGDAPARWGVSEAEYRAQADLWPLNPAGELINWAIVESREGLANVREIAAVPGIGVLFPGAGTLRRVFSSTDTQGNRVFDEAGWETAIQSVLAACEEFDVACGYPATAEDIEMRMEQGFSVFIMGWGERGFAAIDVGRKAAGRKH